MKRTNRPIRVLVVEDSPTARDLLVMLFNQSGDIQVVGTALDGVEAVRRAGELRPDVITMDIQLPRLNGLEATRQILRSIPVPIVIITGNEEQSEMDLTFSALQAGALSLVKKPSLANPLSCEQVIQTVRLMADVPVVRRWIRSESGMIIRSDAAYPAAVDADPASRTVPVQNTLPPQGHTRKGWQIIGIASSTGGPNALVRALKDLPTTFPLPVLVVQHITRGFADSLAKWLDGEIRLPVRLAENGAQPLPGTVLVAPDDQHMQIGLNGSILLNNGPLHNGLRPSANPLFSSLAQVYGPRAIGIILTGMGSDGVDGLAEMHRKGALVIAQDEATSVVYGMPQAAARQKIVDYVLPVDQIGPALIQLAE